MGTEKDGAVETAFQSPLLAYEMGLLLLNKRAA
jgi:hypothetical protein